MKINYLVFTGLISLISLGFNTPKIDAQEIEELKSNSINSADLLQLLKLDKLENKSNSFTFNENKEIKENILNNNNLSTEIVETDSGINSQKELKLSQHNQPSLDSNNQEEWGEPIHDNQTFSLILIDQLEYRVNDNQNTFNWDIVSWVGSDYNKLWIKSEGDVSLDDGNGEAELQLLYGKLIAPYWDFQVGLRYDQLYGDSGQGRGFAVIGIEGLAPYFFELDAALFVSHQGDISARFTAEYELLLSQKLILQPKLETNLAIQKVEEFGVGSGFNNLELGLRLRYEINRQIAPYIGVSWNKLFGETADLAEEDGESSDDVTFVGGVRLMF